MAGKTVLVFEIALPSPEVNRPENMGLLLSLLRFERHDAHLTGFSIERRRIDAVFSAEKVVSVFESLQNGV
jgi:hypothetical protein